VRFEVSRLEDDGTRCGIGSLGKRKVVGQLFGLAPRAWRRAQQAAVHSVAVPTGWVAAARVEEEDDSRRWAKPECPGGPNATWASTERKQEKEREMSRKDDWAEMILGCAEKKKKVFRF
jgi:hypothetical protein